jgi:hypothetical protein
MIVSIVSSYLFYVENRFSGEQNFYYFGEMRALDLLPEKSRRVSVLHFCSCIPRIYRSWRKKVSQLVKPDDLKQAARPSAAKQ